MNPNGSGSYTSKLDRLIAYHESVVQALKTTRDLLNGEAREKKQTGANDALTEALSAEASRSHHEKRNPYGQGRVKLAAQRARSAKFLAQFDTKVPSLPEMNGDPMIRTALGPMVRRGYLVKKADGYIRTNKPYVANLREAWKQQRQTDRAKKRGHHPSEHQRRQASFDFLALFDPDEPRTFAGKPLSSMLRTGYLKRKGDGYVRTTKEFQVARS